MKSTLMVAPLTLALKQREKLVSGLTDRTCKFYQINICFCFVLTKNAVIVVASTKGLAMRWVRLLM